MSTPSSSRFYHRLFFASCLTGLPGLLATGCVTNDPADSADDDSSTGDDTFTGDDTSTGDTGDDGDVAWTVCPEGFVSHCAHVPVPLDWNNPAAGEIDVFISRLPAIREPATRQVWLLQGGPGGSGDVFATVAQALRNAADDLEVYVLEHRGVGESTRLECPLQEAKESDGGYAITEAEMPACIQALRDTWGASLNAMTTTQAARDLSHVISLTSTPEQKVYVYGVSYGVWWALRYLQLDPATASGVILDSLPAPGVQWLSDYDEQFDPVFADLMAFCATDATCVEKLGADAWTRIQAVAASLDQGHCAELQLDRATLSQLSAILLMIDPLRKHLAPLYYRLERCDADDVAVVANYFTTLLSLFVPEDAPRGRGSIPLQYHISLSEIWETPPPAPADLLAACESKVACPYASVSMGQQFAAWPRYPTDPLAGHWPITNVPVLSLNGELDPQTPHGTAAEVTKHLAGPYQTYVQVPYAPHGVMFDSPVKTPGEPVCGLQMVHGFLADPLAPINTACLNDLVPVDFTDNSQLGKFLFPGDHWENEPEESDRSVAVPHWGSVIDALRRAPIDVGEQLRAAARSTAR